MPADVRRLDEPEGQQQQARGTQCDPGMSKERGTGSRDSLTAARQMTPSRHRSGH
jgi:hypothetical protein